ncbi:MAG TPA: ATP-binding protein, partial [Solirubrobacterales bacterium]|nr:ATP-binding protein [Solirubrobacterales bacterium]
REIGLLPFDLLAWAFTSKRSSTPFGPLPLRAAFDRLVSTARARFVPRSRESFAVAMRGGALPEALAVLGDLYRLDAVVLWHYDETRRRFRSLASHGTGDHPFSVPAEGRRQKNRKGVVAQVLPDRRPVVYDTSDRSLWRPEGAGSWEPFDLDLFKARKWRACMAIPIVCSGRLLGALSVYTHLPATTLHAIEQNLTEDAFRCAGAILTRREQEVIEKMAARYDEELLNANVSISALSLSHDVLHYYRSVLTRVTHTKGYLETKQNDLALEKVTEAVNTMERTEPALKAMRKLANEARTHESSKGPQQINDVPAMLTEMERLLKSILPLFSQSKRLPPENVIVTVEGTAKPVKVQPLSFERIVVNLCVNAAQWNASHVWVTAHFDRPGGDFQLVVRDDGRGISPAAREQVFDRFYSARGGSGLGLYVVKSIATAAGGEVHLQSYDSSDGVEQRGTVVTVVLPTK